ncbi:MAG TPA: hypothetical protein VK530_21630 [Candidatus Acidoferrum sp.]|nr:hypothetical protein [Candidatus Acidoferrum sp.]
MNTNSATFFQRITDEGSLFIWAWLIGLGFAADFVYLIWKTLRRRSH